MTTHPLPRILAVLAAVMTVGELISTAIIWREAYPGSQPVFAFAFAVLFAVATWLLVRRRVVAGAVLALLLCAFEVGSAPSWERRNALDWSSQLVFGVVALAGLVVAAVVLVSRVRARRVSVR